MIASLRRGLWQRYLPIWPFLTLPRLPLLVTWAVILRTTCSLPMSPTQSLVGRLEIRLSPWLGYYLTVWPCTSYFASLGLGSLNHKMKEPKTEGCLWFFILFMENKVFKKNNTYFFKTQNTREKWTSSGVCMSRVFSLCSPSSPNSMKAWRHPGLHRASHSAKTFKFLSSPVIHDSKFLSRGEVGPAWRKQRNKLF